MIRQPAGESTGRQFLTSLAQRFIQTRIEILLLFAFIIFLLLVFSVSLLVQRQATHRRFARRSQQMLEHRLGELDLSSEETSLLWRLSAYLNKEESRYSLLVNSRVFDACAARMLQVEEVPDARLQRQRTG